jgi:hypothetical protein
MTNGSVAGVVIPPVASEPRPTSGREFIPGAPRNITLGETVKNVPDPSTNGVAGVERGGPKGVNPLSPAATRKGLMPVVAPNPKGVKPMNGFMNPTGGVTLSPGGNRDVSPGGNNVVDPAGSNPAFRAACCSDRNCMVGVIVFVEKGLVVPGKNMKLDPELCI